MAVVEPLRHVAIPAGFGDYPCRQATPTVWSQLSKELDDAKMTVPGGGNDGLGRAPLIIHSAVARVVQAGRSDKRMSNDFFKA